MSEQLKRAFVVSILLFFTGFSPAGADTAYQGDLVVKGETRHMKVETVFKELLKAYQDEDAGAFLDLVSEEHFRQDYITFTDALYTDFRQFEIYQIDYWINRVVADHVRQFLYVKWEKRFEFLETGNQMTRTGISRFLFDEVNGRYLLIELAGDSLFGGSLPEWVDEVPPVSGSGSPEAVVPLPQTDNCGPGNLSGCTQNNCLAAGGYWYNNSCNTSPQGTSHVPRAELSVDTARCTVVNLAPPQSPSASVSVVVKNSGDAISGTCLLTISLGRLAPLVETIAIPDKNASYHYMKTLTLSSGDLPFGTGVARVDYNDGNPGNNTLAVTINTVEGSKGN